MAVRRPDGTLVTEVVTTSVTFAELSDEVIAWYVATGEPADKAGAYGLQGIGGALVERIDGSVSNVLGLPLTTVRRLLGTGRLALSRPAVANGAAPRLGLALAGPSANAPAVSSTVRSVPHANGGLHP